MKQLRLLPVAVATIVFSGCASMVPPENTQQPRALNTPDPAVVALANAASRIQKSAIELKQVQAAAKVSNMSPEQIKAKFSSDAIVPAGLGNIISIEGYDGPFTNLVEAVAKANNWNYLVEGVKPPVIQVIHKKYNRVKAVDVLRDIGYSITGANIVIDPANKNIIVRFS